MIPSRPVFTDPILLAAHLEVEASGLTAPRSGKPLLVPASFVDRMKKGDLNDPLLRQVLPDSREDTPCPGYSADPVGDVASERPEGFLQKYAGRILLPVTERCPLNCRFCFRRNRPSDRYLESDEAIERAVSAVAMRPDIREIILSGGDPLMLPEETLERLLTGLSNISHAARVRIHTRLPVADPGRVDGELMRVLGALKKPLVVVVHANHPAELDSAVASAFAQLKTRASQLFNQSVLLRGVNDSGAVLAELSEALIAQGVLPYYLHQLDRAAGTAHFEVPVETGRAIVESLRAVLPGWGVPRYVREIPGMPCKTPLL